MGNSTPRVLLMDACGQRNCARVKVKFALCDCISHARRVQLLDNYIPGPPRSSGRLVLFIMSATKVDYFNST